MENNGNIAQHQSKIMLGRYQLLQRIGRGGMGEVWLGNDPRLRRQVAIKTLPPQNQNDREFASRFEREAQAAATLNHPHILPVHDYGEEHLPNGNIINYIVMPYVGNGSLADYLEKLADQHIGVPEQDAINYLMQMAEAIDYAHEQGIIHRDIKPANMLMRSRDWLMLTDFGIARIVDDPRKQTQTNLGAGTPEYMAPEQAQGRAVAASDTYSLAVIAYQFFTGHLPFQADTSYATIVQHITMPPPAPRSYNPHLSPTFENILLRGLAKNPAERFPSASAFVAELQRNLGRAFMEATLIKPPRIPAEPRTTGNSPLAATTTMGDFATVALRTTSNLSPNASRTAGDHTAVRNAPTPEAKKATISRRALISGGAAAAIIVAGAGAWEAATYLLPSSQAGKRPAITTMTNAKPIVQATPDPNGPMFTLLGHNQPVTSLAWSPQKNVLASASDDNTVKLWNLQQYQQQAAITQNVVSQTINGGSNMLAAWSQDGKYIAIANAGESADLAKEYIGVYTSDLSGTAPAYSQPIQVGGLSTIKGIGWMANRYIITILDPLDNTTQDRIQIGLWDTTQPKLQPNPAFINNQVPGGAFSLNVSQLLAISPDNQYIAIALANNLMVGKVSLKGNNVQWQQVGNILQFDTKVPYTTDAVAWSSNSRFLIAIGDAQPGKLVAWDMLHLNAPGVSFNLPGSNTTLTALTCCPVAGISSVACASSDGTIYLWENFANNTSFNPTRALHGNVKSTVTALAWSADGQWLAASYKDTNDTILVWRL
jgi:serine/threonine protein kinase